MSNKISGKRAQVLASGFPENRYEALEESRKLLGMTAKDFNCFLKVLCKSDYGDIHFDLGNILVSFFVVHSRFSLTFSLTHRRLERSIEYKFKLDDIGFPKKQNEVEGLEDE